MPSMMNRPQRTRGRHCYCFACTGDRGNIRAKEKREWETETKLETESERFSARWEGARSHLIESGYDEDVAASMAAIHALNAP